MPKCHWVNHHNPLYIKYHDEEWGIPSYNDAHLFEMLLLESFQAGLSWECILNKRESFRIAFDNFDYYKIAAYDEQKVSELLSNKDIVRNKLKIKAAIKNAQVFITIKEEYGSFSNYIWHFTNNKIIKNTTNNIPTHNELSDNISIDLYKRGMRFVGTIVIYSYLEAIGIINDHELTCDKY